MLKRLSFVLAGLFVLLISLISYWRFNADDMSILLREKEPIAINLALFDDRYGLRGDRLEFLAQMIVFPKEKGIILYCANSNAYHKGKLIRKMNPRSADNFGDYTSLYSSEYIHIKASDGERLLDVLGGITFFVEETLFLKGAKYQYPSGVRYYPGEQVFEYMFRERSNISQVSGTTIKQKSFQKNPQERLFRQESMLLNLFWQRKDIAAQLGSSELKSFASKMISTSLSQKELYTLLNYILDEDINLKIFELPLEIGRRKGKKILQVKEERAEKLFRDQIAKAQISWKKSKENYSLQILNGTPLPGMARRLKFSLQNLGPNIIDVDNYEPKPLAQTMIVERSGDTAIARHLMELVYMKKERVSFNRQVSDIDLSLIIGNDFSLKRFQLR